MQQPIDKRNYAQLSSRENVKEAALPTPTTNF